MRNENFGESPDIILTQQSLSQNVKTKQVPFWPVLLLSSTILNVVLAILLTQQKPSIKNNHSVFMDNQKESRIHNTDLQSALVEPLLKNKTNTDKAASASWAPSDSLPGNSPKVLKINDSASNQTNFKDYESTKLLVQQVFSSYSNSKEAGKVVIDAPVRFNSSTMLWSEEHIQEAREIFAALLRHKQNVVLLKNEAQELSDAWNGLVRSSRPFALLRADSPSLNK